MLFLALAVQLLCTLCCFWNSRVCIDGSHAEFGFSPMSLAVANVGQMTETVEALRATKLVASRMCITKSVRVAVILLNLYYIYLCALHRPAAATC